MTILRKHYITYSMQYHVLTVIEIKLNSVCCKWNCMNSSSEKSIKWKIN